MKGILAILFFYMLAFSIPAQVTEEESVRKTFESYLNSISKGSGEEAVQFVDRHTLAYYNNIAELAKDADSLKIESLATFDKIMVLATRNRVPKEELLKFDGKALFIYAVNNKMVDSHGGAYLVKLGTITMENDTAKGQLFFKETEYPYYLNFYKEDGQWKYDLTSSFALGMRMLQKYVDDMGEKLVIKMALNADPQHKPGPYIWRPLK